MKSLTAILAITPTAIFILGCAGTPKLTNPLQAPVSFEREIQPLLETRCLTCHNEQGGAGDLDLTSRETTFRPSSNGPFIVPGSPEQSKLFRVLGLPSDTAGAMPPNNHALAQAEIDLIEQWISQGAAWPSADKASETP